MMFSPVSADRTGSVVRNVLRHRRDETTAAVDHVVEECPVALVFNGISHAVMMATPIDLDDFALGFALSEGIVERASDVFEIDSLLHAESAEVHLRVSQEAFMALKGKRRALAGRSGCGVCGIESIELLDLHPAPVASSCNTPTIASIAVERASRELRDHQHLMHETGGIHAAAWCNVDGKIRQVFEDVGRHNALDKLIGWLARTRIDTVQGFVFLSSRASYELVRKAARVRVHTLATISAPTSLAINVAQEAGIRLLSFCRGDGFVEYIAPNASIARTTPQACQP